jgi:hypothetical protein
MVNALIGPAIPGSRGAKPMTEFSPLDRAGMCVEQINDLAELYIAAVSDKDKEYGMLLSVMNIIQEKAKEIQEFLDEARPLQKKKGVRRG